MAGFRAAASARYLSTWVAALLPHHSPATKRISNLHLPPAGFLCFTRSYTVPRRGCGLASSTPVPPLRTQPEESLGCSSAIRRRTRLRQALPGATASVVVACALGTVCLLRVAVFFTPLSLSRLARTRSITKAAASGGGLDPHQSKYAAGGSDKDGGLKEVSIEGPDQRKDAAVFFTPVMLDKILVGKQTDSAKMHLVHHVLTAVLAPNKQLQLLELVYQLAFSETDNIIQKFKVFSKDWLCGAEKLEAGLAMAQIYIEMNKYKEAEQVLARLSDPPASDLRVPLLKAAVNMMLEVDLLRSKGNALTIDEVKQLDDRIGKFMRAYGEWVVRSSPPAD